MAGVFAERMLDRGFTVGSNDTTAPIIEASFVDCIMLLEKHLQARPFIFGDSPSMADFGLAGQLYQMLGDVTGGELMRLHTPQVAMWAERMVNPVAVQGGRFEEWAALAPTLEPLLSLQVARFLTWSEANAEAIAAGQEELSVDLGGQQWTQSIGGPQRYHAKSLKEIRRKYAEVASDAELAGVLERCGCLGVLSSSAGGKQARL